MLYEGIRSAIANDNAAIAAGKSPTRQTTATPDWRRCAREMEGEMDRRGIAYHPVVFPDGRTSQYEKV
jgi:hypothetical protein